MMQVRLVFSSVTFHIPTLTTGAGVVEGAAVEVVVGLGVVEVVVVVVVVVVVAGVVVGTVVVSGPSVVVVIIGKGSDTA